jgi:hypothetical protein
MGKYNTDSELITGESDQQLAGQKTLGEHPAAADSGNYQDIGNIHKK